MADKNKKRELRASGYCPSHPSVKSAEGYVVCDKCVDRTKRIRHEAKNNGICTYCYKRHAVSNRSMCGKCNEILKKKHMERYRRYRLMCLTEYSKPKSDVPMCCHEDCSIANTNMLVIDHKNGYGNDHRAEVANGSTIFFWLVKNHFPPGFQVLCANHNMEKAYYKKEW